MKTQLPDGFTLDFLKPEYHQGVVDTLNAFFGWVDQVPGITTLEEMQSEWAMEQFNPETDARVVVDSQGQVVGYSDLYDATSLHTRIYLWVAVRPHLLNQGIEEALLEWAIQRAKEIGQAAPEDARLVLHAFINAACEPVNAFFLRSGFQVVRSSYRMLMDLNQPVTPEVPEGITIRPVEGEAEMRKAIFAAYDSFRDHWGHIDEPFEAYYQRWMQHVKDDPNYDPSLYLAAFEGDEVVGVSLCYPKIQEKPDTGWVGTLGVLRPWRKNGLGLALLRTSFAIFQERGLKHAGLGVDAQNLTGALRLYERAGMHIWRKGNTMEFELRPGVDLMTKTMEA